MANQSFTLNIKALFDASAVKAGVGEIQSSLKSLKLPDKLTTDLNTSFANINKALDDFTSKVEKGVKTKSDAGGITKSFETVTKELTKLDNLMIKVKGQLGEGADLSKIIKLDSKTLSDIGKLENEIKDLQTELAALGQNTEKIKALESALTQLKKGSASFKAGENILKEFKKGNFQEAENIITQITNKLNAAQKGLETQGKSTTGIEATKRIFEQISEIISDAKTKAAGIYEEMGQKGAEAAQKTAQAYDEVKGKVDKVSTALTGYKNSALGAHQAITDLTARQQQFVSEVDQIKSRIQYFFGLANAINLVKRAVRGAVETIKDLDKAMTETAVVTEFTIKDMWSQLPEYTKRANQLGVTTQAAYESATLYFQQGLNAEQAAALSTETLKMARIAGLDAAEATDRMTNALRGFNMALDEQSAQRVDDVYSQLAAHTASNVDEISTAMTKVASLAHNANMEFETTAAFLAQIIETTRESAETAGTALKTVVARFSEVKKLVDEGTLRGTDEEGQAIDVNKVGAALRTAGIDLNKYFLGEVGLDDIFIELASKWDSLTAVQQRYIATQAAGSRQQSRFIALMQDYARTQQLVGMAYEANGASAKQFEKTQDSLQSKLARLSNAWNQFLMGLANSTVVKGVVEGLTRLINGINSLTEALGNGMGSLLKWAAVLGGILAFRSLFSNGGLIGKGVELLTKGTPLGGTDFVQRWAGNKIDSGASALRNSAIEGGAALKEAGIAAGEALKVGAQQAAATDISTKETGAAIETASKETGATIEVSSKETGAAIEISAEETGAGIEVEAAAKAAAFRAAGDVGGQYFKGFYQRYLKAGGIPAGGIPVETPLLTSGAASGTTALIPTSSGALIPTGGSIGASSGVLGGLGIVGTTGFAAALLALEIGGIALQDYVVSGKAEVKKQEKVTKKQEEQVEKSKDLAEKQKEAYEAYIENEKIAQGTTGTEKAQAEANMAEAAAILYGISSQNVTKTDKGLVVDKGYASDYIQTLEQRQKTEEAALAFEEAKLAFDQKQVAWGKQYSIEVDTSNTETAGTIIGHAYNGSAWEGSKHTTGPFADYNEETLKMEKWNAARQEEMASFEAQARQKIAEGASDLLSGVFKDENLIGSVSSAYAAVIGQEALSGKSTEDVQNDLDDLMHIAQDENGKLLLDVLNGSYEGVITDEELQNIFNNLAPEYQKTLESLLVEEGKTIEDALSSQNAKLKRSQFNFRKKAVAELYRSGLTNLQLLDNITNKLSISEEQKLLDFADQWSNYGTEFNETLLSTVADAMLGGTWEGSNLQSFITDIGENPVQAFDAISKAADNSGTEVDKLAQKLLQLNEAQFSRENQVQWFLASGEFENLNDQIDKFIEANGEVTSHNIESLAAECSTLGTLLENDVVSAKALATAINALQSGNISLFDLNSRVLDLFENFESVTSIISRAGQFIKDFDPGEDWGDAYDFIGDATEKMTEFINNRELGNPQLRNYWKAFFTTDPQDLSDWEQGVALLKEMQGMGGGDFWTKAVGFSMDENGIISDMGLDQFAVSEFGSYRDYIKSLAESRGYTDFADTYYDLMIRNMGNHDYGVITDLAAVELNKIVTAFGDGLPDKAEVQALADAYGIDPQDILDAWSEKWDPEGGKLDFNTLEDKVRKTTTKAEDLFTQFLNPDNHYVNQNEAATWNIDKLLATMGIGADGTFSLDTLKLQIGEVVPEVKDKSISIEDWFNEQVKANGGKVTLPVEYQTTEKVGEDQYQTKTITAHVEVESLEEYEAATKQLQDAANQEILGASLAGSLGEAKTEAEQISNILTNLGGNIDLSGITISLGEAANSADAIGEHLVSGFALGANAAKIVDQAVEDIPDTIDITAKYEEVNRPAPIPSVQSVRVIYKESNKPKLATGGLVGSYAKGSENFHVKPGTALTGEEGPEIVWNKKQGYAYVTGSDGPEFQDLQPGDRVFNASETKRIFKNSSVANGAVVDSFGNGTIWGETDDSSGKGGSGEDKDKTSAEWKNELDWLYNLLEDIAELERDQKQLEEEFEDILTDDTKTSKDLYNLLIQRLGNLNVQLDRQTFALTKREQEMREFMDTTNDQDQYLWYNWSDRTLEIDWDAIDKIVDGDVYKHVKDLISEAEEIQGKMDDAEDAIADIKNQIQELENIWRDTYVDFEKRVLDALVKSYQQVIDNYSTLNDTINNSNSEILEAIQHEIDLERQIRDNTETEDDIAQKEARLAYLQRDTTGANATEILKLQEELENSRQDYEDTLVDQALERLQEDNDAAAKQREQQIEIMQAQLDYQKENGEFNEQVTQLISGALSSDGKLLTDSDLYTLLSKQENWAAMSEVNKQVWEEELKSTFKEVGGYLLKTYADWNGEFYSQVAEAINAINKEYQIKIGSYSQPQAGGGSDTSTGGGGGGGDDVSKNNDNKNTKGETTKWSDWSYYNSSQHKRSRLVNGETKVEYGNHSFSDVKVGETSSYITYAHKCTACGYVERTWQDQKPTSPSTNLTKPITPSTPKPSGGCFAPGTKILMGNYRVKNIEDVQINDIIMAYDEVNDEFVSKRVTESYSHHNTPQMVKLTFANNTTIELTPGHPLYSTKGWKSLDIKNSLLEHTTVATLLKIGDIIINIDGSSMLTNIEYLETGDNYTSYNLEVEDCHTFLANGFVAHNALKKVKQAYATGGLNTYTGLAMLHGTPSEPEYVLNARQTQAFLKLADVLPNVITNNSGITNNLGGNIYLDLNMHVDEIGSDYDVDRIANRVKDILYDASSYRNVNTINFIR